MYKFGGWHSLRMTAKAWYKYENVILRKKNENLYNLGFLQTKFWKCLAGVYARSRNCS